MYYYYTLSYSSFVNNQKLVQMISWNFNALLIFVNTRQENVMAAIHFSSNPMVENSCWKRQENLVDNVIHYMYLWFQEQSVQLCDITCLTNIDNQYIKKKGKVNHIQHFLPCHFLTGRFKQYIILCENWFLSAAGPNSHKLRRPTANFADSTFSICTSIGENHIPLTHYLQEFPVEDWLHFW